MFHRLGHCCGRWGWHMSALCQLHLPQPWPNLWNTGPIYGIRRYIFVVFWETLALNAMETESKKLILFLMYRLNGLSRNKWKLLTNSKRENIEHGHWEIYRLTGVEIRDGKLRILWNFGCESIDLDEIGMQAPVRPSFAGANFQLGRKGQKLQCQKGSGYLLISQCFSRWFLVNGGSISTLSKNIPC